MQVQLGLPEVVIETIAQRAAELVLERLACTDASSTSSAYMTVPEAAELLRCKRQRVDDLLSQRRLTRFKEGGRTLVSRLEVEALVEVDRVARALPTVSPARMVAAVAR